MPPLLLQQKPCSHYLGTNNSCPCQPYVLLLSAPMRPRPGKHSSRGLSAQELAQPLQGASQKFQGLMPQEQPWTHASWRTSLKSAASQGPARLSLFFPLFHFLTLPLGVLLGIISKHTRCPQIAVLRLASGGFQPKPPIYNPGRQENGRWRGEAKK